MKKTLLKLACIALVSLVSTQVSATPDDKAIGKAIFKKAMGTGCYGCHAASSNPQIIDLIKAGTLNKADFAKVVKNGKGGMPAIDMMGIKVKDKATKEKKTIKDWGVSEDKAMTAIYDYLKSK
jgi:mono/diheme cytochrome c family protein